MRPTETVALVTREMYAEAKRRMTFIEGDDWLRGDTDVELVQLRPDGRLALIVGGRAYSY